MKGDCNKTSVNCAYVPTLELQVGVIEVELMIVVLDDGLTLMLNVSDVKVAGPDATAELGFGVGTGCSSAPILGAEFFLSKNS